MPNRVLKGSICTSADINGLTWFEEVLFYRLIVSCDDYGCFDGRTAIIKSELFPLKENVTKKSIESAIAVMASVGLLQTYEANGKPYVRVCAFQKHQRIRNGVKGKFPEPLTTPKDIFSDSEQCDDNSRQLAATRGDSRREEKDEKNAPEPPKKEEKEITTTTTNNSLISNAREAPTMGEVYDYFRGNVDSDEIKPSVEADKFFSYNSFLGWRGDWHKAADLWISRILDNKSEK